MRTTKRYNPNNFNALHAASAYAIFVALSLAFRLLWDYDEANGFCLGTCALFLATGIVVAVFSFSAKCNPVSGGGFLVRKGCGMEILMAIALVAGVTNVFLPLINEFAGDFEYIRALMGITVPGGLPENGNGGAWIYVYLFFPLLSAVFEELLFRGIVFRGLMQWGKVPALIFSSFLFAVASGNVYSVIYRLILGLVLGFLFLETKNIFVTMAANFTAAHFVGNYIVSWSGAAYLFACNRSAQEAYEAVIGIMCTLIGLVCLIAGVVYFFKRKLHSETKGESSSPDVAATYVVRDEVSGTVFVERPWYTCGGLIGKGGEQKVYLRGERGRGRVNEKATFVLPAVFLSCAAAIAVVAGILAFFGAF